MRDQLDHLPEAKQRELERVVQILFEEFDAATRTGTKPFKKQGRILKLVLYGSYARGDWVDDPVGGYHSDYDILVVVNDERLTDFEYWSAAEDRLMREVTITHTLRAPVGFIVHTLTDVNTQLYKGRPFFTDIAAQGIALYEAEGHPLSRPGKLQMGERLAEARQYFDRWFTLADQSIKTAGLQLASGDSVTWRNDAAFTYHQAVERLYHCSLLVLTLYSPKSHKLNFLRGQAEDLAASLIDAWPSVDRFDRRCFELLRLAYVNARYSPEYSISAEELAWISERVAILQDLVRTVCEQRLIELETALPKAAE
jgi:predicted nucleotidyltransferase/HEPN domain-containing protein